MKIPNPKIKLNRAGISFLTSVAMYLFLSFLIEKYEFDGKTIKIFYDLFLHLALFLAAVTGAHLLEKAYTWGEITEFTKNALKEVLAPSLQLVDSSNRCGIEKIYVSRKEAVSDILSAIHKSEYRVWMAGIAFSENLKFEEILRLIKPKIDKNKEYKFNVLLTDVFKSPAVFRSFIEGDENQVETMLSYIPGKYKNSEHPYFHHKLFKHFYNSYSTILYDTKIQDFIKYHAHNPNCWLVIIDNTAYFQPYTLGRGTNVKPEKTSIGPLMPVIKFQKNDDVNTFSILVDHFIKLWKTSTSDFYNIKAKYSNREQIINTIFETRSFWLYHVWGALFKYKNNNLHDLKERREFTRRCCHSDYSIVISMPNGSYSVKIKAKIKNISKNGICLIIDDVDNLQNVDSVFIDLDEYDNNLFISNVPSLGDLVYESKCKFDIIWKEQIDNKLELGLTSTDCEYDPNKII